jgi:pyruvate/2-oxoglutarate dehydrogenase complex dihydrolipoamide acyltransferase (E2) component
MPRYSLLPAHPFFELTSGIVQHEISPGNTVSFISEVDLTEVEALRANSARKPSYTAFVAKAVALALREFPYANRRLVRRWWLPFSGFALQQFLDCDIAVACEREVAGAESAAFIDVLRQADARTLEETNAWLRQLAACDLESNEQWRSFHWIATRLPRPLAALVVRLPLFFPSMWHRYRGGAVLISSPAKYGVDGVVGSWTAPLGVSFGLVKPRPVVKDGRIVACPTFQFLLNFDRRIMAGAQAARFFNRIVEILTHAQSEMGPSQPAIAARGKTAALVEV